VVRASHKYGSSARTNFADWYVAHTHSTTLVSAIITVTLVVLPCGMSLVLRPCVVQDVADDRAFQIYALQIRQWWSPFLEGTARVTKNNAASRKGCMRILKPPFLPPKFGVKVTEIRVTDFIVPIFNIRYRRLDQSPSMNRRSRMRSLISTGFPSRLGCGYQQRFRTSETESRVRGAGRRLPARFIPMD
jgi:hypothetical protein